MSEVKNGDKNRQDNDDSEEESKKDNRGSESKDGDQDQKKDEEDDDDADLPIYERPLFWIIGGIVLLVIIIGGVLWWLHARRFESTDDAFVDAHIVRLAPQISGVLTWVAPSDNKHVKPGDLLAVIEPAGPEAERAQQEAGVAEAQAGVKQAEGKLIAAQAARAQAFAEANGPEATAVQQQRDLERYLSLSHLDPMAVAPTQLDAARAQAKNSNAQATAARKQVASADANVLVAKKEIDAARANLSAAQARLRQSNVTVGYLRLTAPVAGQVVNRAVNVGSFVSPGTQLMAIVPDEMWITANYKETQLTHMKAGQHVDIKVDAFPGVHFDGHIDSIQRGAGQAFALLPAQNATGNYVKVVQRVPVRILFDRPNPRQWAIGPGMSVTPRVTVR